MELDLTRGGVTRSILAFSLPLMVGNFFQQCYNVADTLIVGRFIGPQALAAVGASYTLMTFLTSVLLGLCMGSGVVFSFYWGAGDTPRLRRSVFHAFLLILAVTAVIQAGGLLLLDGILRLLRVDPLVYGRTREYLAVVLWGTALVALYNFCCAVLRSMGNSTAPLIFLILSSLLNVGLDYLLVVPMGMDVYGAGLATVISQGTAAALALGYCLIRAPRVRPGRDMLRFDREIMTRVSRLSFLACLQQSIMNFGILMIQGLVNSFGVTVMAGFAAAVKIDNFAYMPMQDFGNAFSTFVAQNRGAGQDLRVEEGRRSALRLILITGAIISLAVCLGAEALVGAFVGRSERAVVAAGVGYLRVVGPCYCLIGILFLLYGFYRGLDRAGMSVVLTVISLGTRVVLAYALAPRLGVGIVWWAIPIGWALADAVGLVYYHKKVRGRTGPAEGTLL